MSDAPELTDEEITVFIDDPALIATHEVALEVMATLDTEIASIQAQIDAASVEAAAAPLPPERQDWLRRAAFAVEMRKRDWHKIYRRDKELRHVLGPAQLNKKRDPETGRLKQARLKLEAENRREKNRLAKEQLCHERNKLKSERAYRGQFVNAAKRLLPPEWLERIEATIGETND